MHFGWPFLSLETTLLSRRAREAEEILTMFRRAVFARAGAA